MDAVRIDKWLWAARFYKTRALATEAVLGGHVHVNGTRVRPAKDVRAGDTVQIRIGPSEWVVEIAAIADKRGPASVAQQLYVETDQSKARREQQRLERRVAPPPLGADLGARPTKQDRRRLEALRRAQRGGR